MLERLARALDARDLDVARSLLRQLVQQRGERDANVLLMGAVLARLEGRLEPARATLATLRRAAPGNASIAFQLGLSHAALGARDDALLEFRAVLAMRPAHADAAFNLGLLLRGLDDAAAGHAFFLAARHRPEWMDAYQQALECAARLAASVHSEPVRHDASLANPVPARHDAARAEPVLIEPSDGEVESRTGVDDTLVSFVVCSVDAARLATLHSNIDSLFTGQAWELLHTPDARSLSEGYNRGARQAHGDILVFCHDDVRFLAPDFRARLLAHLKSHEVIGVAGSTQCTGPAALWSGAPAAQGWVVYPAADGTKSVTICGTRGPVVENVQVLDGLFIAARRAAYERLRFDETTFDGFHLYDLDFSYRAHLAGARVAICADLLAEHASLGGFDARWEHYAARFRQKFPAIGQHAAAREQAFRVSVADEATVRRVYGWIGAWCSALDEGGLP